MRKIQDDRVYQLLESKLFIETILRSSLETRTKDILDPIFEVNRTLISLKLPSIVPKDKIKKEKTGLSKEELAEWKEILSKAKSDKQN